VEGIEAGQGGHDGQVVEVVTDMLLTAGKDWRRR